MLGRSVRYLTGYGSKEADESRRHQSNEGTLKIANQKGTALTA